MRSKTALHAAANMGHSQSMKTADFTISMPSDYPDRKPEIFQNAQASYPQAPITIDHQRIEPVPTQSSFTQLGQQTALGDNQFQINAGAYPSGGSSSRAINMRGGAINYGFSSNVN